MDANIICIILSQITFKLYPYLQKISQIISQMLQDIENNEPKPNNKSQKMGKQQQGSLPFKSNFVNSMIVPKMRDLGKYQFSFDWKLGSGLTSDAYMGRNKENKQMVCVKVLDLATYKTQSQKKLLDNEIKCQEKLKSEYIINILDIYDTNSFCFIITELCEDGDLFKLIQFMKNGLPEPLVVKFGYQIATALLKLKHNQIIHRDIKSENILLSKGVAKLGDFGFAIQEKNLQTKQVLNVGSPLYMPLQALEQNTYGYESDIFSYGVVLYEMLHGQSPWQCQCQKQLIKRIKTQQVQFKDPVSEPMRNLIRRCLQKEKENRITIEQVLQSEIFLPQVQKPLGNLENTDKKV